MSAAAFANPLAPIRDTMYYDRIAGRATTPMTPLATSQGTPDRPGGADYERTMRPLPASGSARMGGMYPLPADGPMTSLATATGTSSRPGGADYERTMRPLPEGGEPAPMPGPANTQLPPSPQWNEARAVAMNNASDQRQIALNARDPAMAQAAAEKADWYAAPFMGTGNYYQGRQFAGDANARANAQSQANVGATTADTQRRNMMLPMQLRSADLANTAASDAIDTNRRMRPYTEQEMQAHALQSQSQALESTQMVQPDIAYRNAQAGLMSRAANENYISRSDHDQELSKRDAQIAKMQSQIDALVKKAGGSQGADGSDGQKHLDAPPGAAVVPGASSAPVGTAAIPAGASDNGDGTITMGGVVYRRKVQPVQQTGSPSPRVAAR
ncbi:MAG TPA: hypothetical protein VH253_17040 [Phycisphaerae bacterium]|nr:hypothetical protein [Phycisphaerae bacterium]